MYVGVVSNVSNYRIGLIIQLPENEICPLLQEKRFWDLRLTRFKSRVNTILKFRVEEEILYTCSSVRLSTANRCTIVNDIIHVLLLT